MHSHSELTERQIFQWLQFEANAQVENLLQWSFILMTICILWLIKHSGIFRGGPMARCDAEQTAGNWLVTRE